MRKHRLPYLPSPIEVDQQHPPWVVTLGKDKIREMQTTVDQVLLIETTDQRFDILLLLLSLREGCDILMIHGIDLLHRHHKPLSTQPLEPKYLRGKLYEA